ncbi:hypothetical protein TrCOL_g4876 [Triparma columacea]|uniref:Glycerol-3-phosphate dehydrogenase [NAD(+)] n=1 Tax=Triparma columacea TaxID=722753 RepID=A0A9W7G7E9_9STRA|nr:hypothetical protein TrCOL_g4876 [Triparma columacea]
MKDLHLPPKVTATSDPASALADATFVVHAVPVQYSRSFLSLVSPHLKSGTPVLSASKGIEVTSLGFMNDILKEALGDRRSYAFLSGPSFAREIMEEQVTSVVIASEDRQLAEDLADVFGSDVFRVYTSQDVVGVEVGGSVKNVIALAAGMCEGLGLGTNAMSGLVTRGCAEMRRLGLYLGAEPSTMAGLSGVGDTFGTCFGPLSRNRNVGIRIGKGEKLEDIKRDMNEVAEGVETAGALVELIKMRNKGYRLDLKYPIIFGVKDILDGDLDAREGLEGLMRMKLRMESYEATH